MFFGFMFVFIYVRDFSLERRVAEKGKRGAGFKYILGFRVDGVR